MLPKHDAVQWKDGKEAPTGQVHAGMVLDHHHSKDGRHFVGRGGVASDEVIPVSEAVAYFTARIEESPAVFDLMNRARAYYHLKNLDEAEADCTSVLKLDPRNGHALSLRARCRLAQHDAAGALWDANQAIHLDSEIAATWYARAHILYTVGQLDGALADVERALDIAPHS